MLSAGWRACSWYIAASRYEQASKRRPASNHIAVVLPFLNGKIKHLVGEQSSPTTTNPLEKDGASQPTHANCPICSRNGMHSILGAHCIWRCISVSFEPWHLTCAQRAHPVVTNPLTLAPACPKQLDAPPACAGSCQRAAACCMIRNFYGP